MKTEYRPQPINTSRIHLRHDLIALTETLAENAHDQWAQRRMKDGWQWGPKRCDVTKKHPCLVPYEHLPESEKEYDRVAAMQTIKAIVALGYSISK